MTSHRAWYHLRQEGGAREIDLIAELGLQRVIGLEIKARSAPSAEFANIWCGYVTSSVTLSPAASCCTPAGASTASASGS